MSTLPQEGCLGRPGHYWQAARIGDQLAEQRVGHAATDQVDGPDPPTSERDGIADRVPDGYGHAIEDAAQDLRLRL
jgi:hypothetical protein